MLSPFRGPPTTTPTTVPGGRAESLRAARYGLRVTRPAPFERKVASVPRARR